MRIGDPVLTKLDNTKSIYNKIQHHSFDISLKLKNCQKEKRK